MTDRDGDCIASVLVELALRELHLSGEHALDLGLVRLAVARQHDLHLGRLVLEHRYVALLEHGEDHAARLRHADRACRVAAHEQLFERCLRGMVLGDEGPQVVSDRHEARTFAAGNGRHRAARDHAVGLCEQRETGARKAWIDADYQPVRSAWHLSIRFYTCAETLSRTSAPMSKSAGKGCGPSPRPHPGVRLATRGGLYDVHVWE